MISKPPDILESSRTSWTDRVKRRLNVAKLVRRRRDARYQRALHRRGWYDLSVRSEQPAIFVGGCGRSGTTLMKVLLNSHPRVFCGPETSMFGLPFTPRNLIGLWDIHPMELERMIAECDNLVRFAERFFSHFAERNGKHRWADKTPNNVRVINRLLTWFPNSRFIHVIRDGRDVACSLRHHPKEKLVNGRIVPVHINNPIEQCAKRWLEDTSSGLAYRSHPRYCEIRYEDLVRRPEHELIRICRFLDEPFDLSMLDTRHRVGVTHGDVVNNYNAVKEISDKSIGRWQHDLSRDERLIFDSVAGELLIATGYEADHAWCLREEDASGTENTCQPVAYSPVH